MARNFPDFLSAYEDYALDGFVPDRFHEWVGRSVLAAALERKVTLRQGRIFHFPNIYVMLVSHPAVGKSTAIDAGTDLLEQLRAEYNPNFRIIPNQATEPALIDLMKIIDYYQVSPSVALPQSAGFFYASEASASALQNTCGDFVATMTAFYDCPRWFRKKLKGDRDPTEIENSCMNLLAGTTFNYLKTLVNEQSVLGGFASRLIYVVSPERKVRKTAWGSSQALDSETARKLVEDLSEINKLVGLMTPSPGFISCWETFQPQFDQYLIDLGNERLEAIMSRKGTNLLKLSMIFSVSEGNSLVVTEKHFERALAVIEAAYKDNASIIIAAQMADKNSQAGITQAVLQALVRAGGRLPSSEVKASALSGGYDADRIQRTIEMLLGAKAIVSDPSSGFVSLAGDANRYL